jgi:hypothetical protein
MAKKDREPNTALEILENRLGLALRDLETAEEAIASLQREVADSTASAAHWQAIAENYRERTVAQMRDVFLHLADIVEGYTDVDTFESTMRNAGTHDHPTVEGLALAGGLKLRQSPGLQRPAACPEPGCTSYEGHGGMCYDGPERWHKGTRRAR